MESAPAFTTRSTAARTSASSFIFAVATPPELMMRGPLISPLSTFRFSSSTPALSSPPDCTVVTPDSRSWRMSVAAFSLIHLATPSGPRPPTIWR